MSLIHLALDEPPSPVGPSEGAGFSIRAVARLIDMVTHIAVGIGTGLFFGIVIGIAAAVLGGDTHAVFAKVGTTPPLGYLASLVGAVWYVGWQKMRESPKRQRIGDGWANTVVVHMKTIAAPDRPSGLRFVGALGLGLAGDSGILFLEMMSRLL